MKIIEDASVIEKHQMKLKSKFFFSADKKPKPALSWKSPTGKFPYEVNYVSGLRIWGCYIQDPHNTKRHWNGYGVGEPASGKATTVDLIISFAHEKDDKSQAGVFVENSNGEILICHSGDIYRGKELFWEKYKGEVIECTYGDNTSEKFAYVANLSSGNCMREIADFVKMVKMMRVKKKKKIA